jgi:probable HAF family extracellular repeat protein
MGLNNQNLARWRSRNGCAMQCAHVAKHQRARSERECSLRFGAAALVCTTLIFLITTGRSRADDLFEIGNSLFQGTLAIPFATNPTFRSAKQSTSCGVMYYINQDDEGPSSPPGGPNPQGGAGIQFGYQTDLPGSCGEVRAGAAAQAAIQRTLYGTIAHLGTNPGNTITVLAAGFGSQFTAAGWSDTDAGTLHSFQWTLSGGTLDLGTLLGSAGNSIAFGMSDDASTIVGWSNTTPGSPFPSGQHAFRWTQVGGMQDLGSLQGSSGTSIAYAANSDGSVVVGQTDMPPNGPTPVPPHAFRWTQAAGMQDLGSLSAGFGSTAYAVSGDGSVVVGSAAVSGGNHVFRWTQATGMQDLGTLPGLNQATATSVSADGSIVVGYADPTTALNGATGWAVSANSLPFRWTQATGLQNLTTLLANGGVNMTGIALTAASGISRDGAYILGSGTFPDTPSESATGYLALYCDAAVTCPTAVAAAVNTHDFNGDGKSDIAWRNTNGDVAIWLMNGTQTLSASDIGNVPTSWSIVGQRQLNNSGYADLIWRNTNGDVAIWLMNGTQTLSASDIGNVPTSWSIAGTSAYNATNGYAELIWRNTGGDVAIWQMNGTQVLSSPNLGNVPTSWSIVGTGDFSGTGNTDILWLDTAGDVAIWFMNGTQVVSTPVLGNVTTSWTIVGTGDFNGDGKTDILWHNANGDVAIWLMNGTQVVSGLDLGNVPANWSIAETGDFNGDGYSDILWRDTAGDVGIWFMNGTQVVSAPDIGNVPTSWTIQGANAD